LQTALVRKCQKTNKGFQNDLRLDKVLKQREGAKRHKSQKQNVKVKSQKSKIKKKTSIEGQINK